MNYYLIYFLLAIHVIVSIFLLLIVLMQRPKSEGLGTAFGGGVTDTLFGSSTGNVLTKITTWLGVIFFLTTISLAYLHSHKPVDSLSEQLRKSPVPIEEKANPSAAGESQSSEKPIGEPSAPSQEMPAGSKAPSASESKVAPKSEAKAKTEKK